MGNRAVITTKEGFENQSQNVGVYLHWNGGRDSVEAFLKYCELKGYRCPENDNYGWASLVTVITNFFDCSGRSVGIDTVDRLDTDNYDNGVYIIEKWKIVDRKHFEGLEQNHYPLVDMVCAIDECMPKKSRIGEERIKEMLQIVN